MQAMTVEQLRAAHQAGGVLGVTLKGQGAGFLVHINTRSGTDAVLAKARSNEPRRFGNPLSALNVLLELGITVGQFDASEYDPNQQQPTTANQGRAQAMRQAHEAAAYNQWLAGQIQASIEDPRPNISHADAMAELDALLTEITPNQA